MEPDRKPQARHGRVGRSKGPEPVPNWRRRQLGDPPGRRSTSTYGEPRTIPENIVHLVLARTPPAPRRGEGPSAFRRPEISARRRRPTGRRKRSALASPLEHKLGHPTPSPTWRPQFFGGPNSATAAGATGWLCGRVRTGGLAAMFTMDEQRPSLGRHCQGVAIAEAGLSARRAPTPSSPQQGRAVGDGSDGGPSARSSVTPTWRRMLLTMKAKIEAARGRPSTYHAAAELDRGQSGASDRGGAGAAPRRRFRPCLERPGGQRLGT